MKILSIDTSADDTSAAVTDDLVVLSNIVWSQASIHAKWGGIVPNIGRLEHEKRIGLVIKRAINGAHLELSSLDAVAVTVGPGLGIALGVGINEAKKIAQENKLPLIGVNHIEAHLLSSLGKPKSNNKQEGAELKFPNFGLVISGGNTLLVQVEKIGNYKVLAQTRDDALGEALDKAGRMLGLGYPAGPVVEKMARKGNSKKYLLPVPVVGREKEHFFSYSGIKTSLFRLIESIKSQNNELTKEDIQDLCASFQDVAFKHLIRVVSYVLSHSASSNSSLLVGGGVCQNIEVRKRLRKMCKDLGLKVYFPYTKKLCGDNAAMIGITAFYKFQRKEFIDIDKIDRLPNLKIDQDVIL
ncbi:tRNA (adenosine(37)-N6)-threonylcarbamoyltransferase complex transferase subunit TsaD [Candidatus Woesebacteria bacterium]|nr:tRNA (adenosine(37)-N6)-threonylcarbamoyltransferase complex transferase subunit TsaD [Candidatus Woesebacteria bacterium]